MSFPAEPPTNIKPSISLISASQSFSNSDVIETFFQPIPLISHQF